jgi:hypothetical protein
VSVQTPPCVEHVLDGTPCVRDDATAKPKRDFELHLREHVAQTVEWADDHRVARVESVAERVEHGGGVRANVAVRSPLLAVDVVVKLRDDAREGLNLKMRAYRVSSCARLEMSRTRSRVLSLDLLR